jgi:bacterioferritin
MGTMGTKIVGMDVKELITMLNKALADEWLAVYQYWAGAKVVKGPMRPNVQEELEEHAKEEMEHANLLADRIVALGGTPIIDIAELSKLSSCGYDAPKDPHVQKILTQNIKGEQCAISVYHKMLEKVKLGNDPVTFHLIRKILQDEVKHEEDLQNLQEDIGLIK